METADDEEEEEGVKILLFDLFVFNRFHTVFECFLIRHTYSFLVSPKMCIFHVPGINVMWHF